MRYILFSMIFLSCGRNSKISDDVYDPVNFVRITSDQDSIKEMRVVYLSRKDKNRNMIRMYYNDGSLLGISYYYKSKRDGHWVHFLNSKISFEGSFSDGKKIGLHKYYFQNGMTSLIEEYKNGIIVSKTEYAEDGKVLLSEKYETK